MQQTYVLIGLGKDLLKKIDAQAKKEKRKRAQVVRKAIEAYLLEQESAEYFATKRSRG